MARHRHPSADRAAALRETLVAIFGLGEPSKERVQTVLTRVAPEDVAAILDDFSDEEMLLIYESLPSNEARGIVLEATDQQSTIELLEGMTQEQRAEVLEELPVNDLVDYLEDLPEAEQEEVIARLEKDEAEDVKELLTFGRDTAGGSMTTDFISVPSGVTSRAALEILQGNIAAEVIAYVYILQKDERLTGVASIRDVLRAQPETTINEYMARDPIVVTVETDREEVATLVDKYNYGALPVVDSEGMMKGIVTFDDVIDAVREEHSEDMLRMAGTVAIHPFYEPVYLGVIKRLPFLLVTMIGGMGIIVVKEMFDGKIDDKLLSSSLAVIPLVIALAGNVAIVSSTIMVRGLATGDITPVRVWRAMAKEITIGLLIGLILSVVVVLSLTFFGYPSTSEAGDSSAGASKPPNLAGIAAIALCASVLFAALVGCLIPVLCRFTGKIDPAIASGPFVTMLCDLTASFIFLSLVYILVT